MDPFFPPNCELLSKIRTFFPKSWTCEFPKNRHFDNVSGGTGAKHDYPIPAWRPDPTPISYYYSHNKHGGETSRKSDRHQRHCYYRDGICRVCWGYMTSDSDIKPLKYFQSSKRIGYLITEEGAMCINFLSLRASQNLENRKGESQVIITVISTQLTCKTHTTECHNYHVSRAEIC